MLKTKRRVAVKIGSNVMTRSNKELDVTAISAIVDDVMALRDRGIDVILISSGAVASGRGSVNEQITTRLDKVSKRQLYSTIGQVKLMNRYHDLFAGYGVVCGQVLTTKENFSNRIGYLNQKNCIEVMLEAGVVPIINENDAVSVTELMFTDNDELSGLISTMLKVESLVILSNIDGIYDGDPQDERSKVIPVIDSSVSVEKHIQTTRSSLGRGGMTTKCRIAKMVASEGVEVVIANGKRKGILTSLFVDGGDVVCTRFPAAQVNVSNVKRWIAHSDSFSKGKIHINKGATDVLRNEQAKSLLMVGVERVEGEFLKDDIVRIISDSGQDIGVGKVCYDSSKAKQIIGQKGHKPIIHYDYLFVK